MTQTTFQHLTTGLFVQKEWDIDNQFDLIIKWGPNPHYFSEYEAAKLRAYLTTYMFPVKQKTRTLKER